jgi:hypothetical protein
MHNGTNSNGRDRLDPRTESLLTNAGASLGRVLDDRQRHAVNLALEVFAYLCAALPQSDLEVTDVIRFLKWYTKGVSNAKGE